MGKKRAPLNIDDPDDSIDLSGFHPQTNDPMEKPDQVLVEAITEQSGFLSREPIKKKRRRRKPSPYTDQLNIKCRNGMKDIFQDLGERMDVRDHTTFERAIRALIKKEGFSDLLSDYERITK